MEVIKIINAMNASEKQLAEFLESKHEAGEKIKATLRPQGDQTIILSEEVNLCKVSIKTKHEDEPRMYYYVNRHYYFGGISEKVFDQLINQYEIR